MRTQVCNQAAPSTGDGRVGGSAWRAACGARGLVGAGNSARASEPLVGPIWRNFERRRRRHQQRSEALARSNKTQARGCDWSGGGNGEIIIIVIASANVIANPRAAPLIVISATLWAQSLRARRVA